MESNALFDSQTDYEVPLLRLLAELPNGQGRTVDVCRLFEKKYQAHIPKSHYGTRTDGSPIWENNVHWSREHLKRLGFLDGSTRGVWKITDAGRQWLAENPQATRVKGVKRGPRGPRQSASQTVSRPAAPGITIEMLEQTRKVMPADQFRQVWGELYDQLVAQERAKAITEINQTELGRRARDYLNPIHAFLSGRLENSPSGEQLANWILFCYVLELYREASSLFSFIQEESIDPALYKWVKRVSNLCRNKLPG